MPRLLRLSRRDRLPIYEQVRAHTLIDPYKEVPLGRHYDENGDEIADQGQVHPIKRPGEPMRYRRDVARDDSAAIVAETDHVRAHLSSVADADDDPDTHADQVSVDIIDHLDGDPGLVSIVGELDAEPNAPYLRDDFDPAADTQFVFTRYSEEGRE